MAVLACLLWSAGAQAAVATPDGGYSPTRVLVKYATAGAAGASAHAAGVSEEGSSTPLGAGTRVVNLARGESVSSALARILGATGLGSAMLGVFVQLLIGVSLLPLARRFQRRWQGWWTGRP